MTEQAENQASEIVITFPNGEHTTAMEIRLQHVGPAQIEIAGNMLTRHATHLLTQMMQQQQAMQMQPKVQPYRTLPGELNGGN